MRRQGRRPAEGDDGGVHRPRPGRLLQGRCHGVEADLLTKDMLGHRLVLSPEVKPKLDRAGGGREYPAIVAGGLAGLHDATPTTSERCPECQPLSTSADGRLRALEGHEAEDQTDNRGGGHVEGREKTRAEGVGGIGMAVLGRWPCPIKCCTTNSIILAWWDGPEGRKPRAPRGNKGLGAHPVRTFFDPTFA